MKIKDARLFRYCLLLVRPLALRSNRISAREGLIVQLVDSDGHVGWGEIAPLPGFSAESFDEARDSVVHALRAIGSIDLPETTRLMESGVSVSLKVRLPASVAFGIESAALNLRAQSQGTELRHLIESSAPDSIHINGLLTGSKEEVLNQARWMIDNSYAALKLKVGSESIAAEIEKVKSIRAIMPPYIQLRLDANRAWNLGDAVRFGKEVCDLDLEYIEEPVADPHDLEMFHQQTGLHYALDESLILLPPKDLAPANGLVALILKPTLLGGLAATFHFAQRANQLGLQSVISSAFESSIGLVTLANLASAIAPTVACGLDTGSWFADDPLSPPLCPRDGRIHLADFSSDRISVRSELLTELPVI